MRVAHRRAGVDQQVTLRVRVGAIFFDEVAIRATEQPPIEIAQIVAGIVLPIFGELGREARERRAMQTRHESFDHCAREQFERTNPREQFRVEKSCGAPESGLRRLTVRRRPPMFQIFCPYANSFSSIQSALWFRHRFDQLLDHLIRIDLLGLGLKIQQHPMTQHRWRNGAHVFARNVVAAAQDRARLAAKNQELRSAQRSAPRHPLVDEIRRGRRARPARV